MFTVALSIILLQMVDMSSCWSYIDVQLGMVPVQLASAVGGCASAQWESQLRVSTAPALLWATCGGQGRTPGSAGVGPPGEVHSAACTLHEPPLPLPYPQAFACVAGFLAMPKGAQTQTILQGWLQEFAWTEADLPAAVARRDGQLRRATAQLDSVDSGIRNLWRALSLARQGVSDVGRHLTGRPSSFHADARDALHAAPIFCMERAVKLSHWARLAYLFEVWRAGGPPG